MGPVTARRLGTATAAIAAGLLVTVLAACDSSPSLPSAPSTVPASALPFSSFASAVVSAASADAAPAPSAPPACSLLQQADVLAAAATFRGTTITIDGHSQVSQPPLDNCAFNQKGVFASGGGITSTLSGALPNAADGQSTPPGSAPNSASSRRNMSPSGYPAFSSSLSAGAG